MKQFKIGKSRKLPLLQYVIPNNIVMTFNIFDFFVKIVENCWKPVVCSRLPANVASFNPWELMADWSKRMRYQFLNQSEIVLEWFCNSWGVKSKYLENWFWLVNKILMSFNKPIRISVAKTVDLRGLRTHGMPTILCESWNWNKHSIHVFVFFSITNIF